MPDPKQSPAIAYHFFRFCQLSNINIFLIVLLGFDSDWGVPNYTRWLLLTEKCKQNCCTSSLLERMCQTRGTDWVPQGNASMELVAVLRSVQGILRPHNSKQHPVAMYKLWRWATDGFTFAFSMLWHHHFPLCVVGSIMHRTVCEMCIITSYHKTSSHTAQYKKKTLNTFVKLSMHVFAGRKF